MTPVCCTSLSMRPWKDVLPVHARMYKGGRLSTGIWRTPYSEKEPSGGIELSCSDGRREKSRPGACPHAQGSVHFPRHMADAIQREGAVRRNRAVMLRRTLGKRYPGACSHAQGSVHFPRHMADAIQREGAVRRNRAGMLRRTAGKRFSEACPPGSVTFDSGIRR